MCLHLAHRACLDISPDGEISGAFGVVHLHLQSTAGGVGHIGYLARGFGRSPSTYPYGPDPAAPDCPPEGGRCCNACFMMRNS